MKHIAKVGASARPVTGCLTNLALPGGPRSLRSIWLRSLLLLITSLAMGLAGLAQATTYTYDANGRLRSATNASGVTATYQYDARGNILSIGSKSASTMVITSFAPDVGMAGEQVTIWGRGFSAVRANDTVKFGSVAATVLANPAPTATQLTVVVPTTAPFGSAPITVTNSTSTPAVSATSQDNFTVTSVGLPPSITTAFDGTVGNLFAVSSVLNSAPDTITITGKNLYPVPYATTVTIDGVFAFAISPDNTASPGGTMTQSKITFTLPIWAGSGPITVTTPYGSATYGSPLVVIPYSSVPGVNGSTFNTVQAVAVNPTNPAAIGLGGSNKANTVLLFPGNVGDYDSIQTSGYSISNSIQYYVQSPLGMIVAQGQVSQTSPSVALPQLNENGTYSVFFELNGASATSFSAGVYTDTVMVLNGNGTVSTPTITTTVPGQQVRLLFNATAGASMGWALTGIPSGISIRDSLIAPDGTLPTSWQPPVNYMGFGSCSSTGCSRNLLLLPMTGTYQILLAPNGNTTMSFTATLSIDQVAAITAPLTTTAQSVSFSNLAAGQKGIVTFTTTSLNQAVTLAFSGIETTPAVGQVALTVLYPDNDMSDGNATAPLLLGMPSSAQTFNLTLSEPGTYRVLVDAGAGGNWYANALSSLTASVMLNPNAVALTTSTSYLTPSTPLASQIYSTAQAGQIQTFTFYANQGDNLGLAFTSLKLIGTGSMSIAVTAPDGSTKWGPNGNGCTTSGCAFNLTNAPMTGNYQVKVIPNNDPNGAAGTMTFTATLSLDQVKSIPNPVSSTSQSVSFSNLAAGQNGWITFSTNGFNQQVILSFLNVQPSGIPLAMTLYMPDGSVGQSSWVGSSLNFNLSLGQPGTYRLFLDPQNDSSAAALQSLSATLMVNSSGSALTTSTTYLTATNPVASQTYSTTVSGQAESFTFYANQGDNLGLAFTGVALSADAGNSMAIEVIAPDGSMPFPPLTDLSGGQCTASGCAFNLNNPDPSKQLFSLPMTGTYTVKVWPNNGNNPAGTMTFTATLSLDKVIPVDTALSSTPQSVNFPALAAGQNGWISFSTSAYNQSVTLAISSLSTALPAGGQPYLTLYYPDGTTTSFIGWPSSPQSFTFTTPEVGTYRLFIDPQSGNYSPASLSSFAAQLSSAGGNSGGSPTGTPFNSYRSSTNGQPLTFTNVSTASMTFFARKGDNLGLGLTGWSFGGGAYMASVSIMLPDGGGWPGQSGQCSGNGSDTADSCAFNLWAAPETGTYQITVSPNNGGTATFTANLALDQVGPLTLNASGASNPTPAVLPAGAAGQPDLYTYNNTTVGQQVSLSLSQSPSLQQRLIIYYPDGTSTRYDGMSPPTARNFTLNEKGVYSFLLYPMDGWGGFAPTAESAQSAMLVAYANGTALTTSALTTQSASAQQSYGATAPGQAQTFTFYATTGQDLALAISNLQYSGPPVVTNGSAAVSVTMPDGNAWQNIQYCGNCAFSLMNAPETGTYTVRVSPNANNIGNLSFTATLSLDQVAALTLNPAATPNPVPATLTAGAVGQIDTFTYTNNTIGQVIALGIDQTSSVQGCLYIVYPNGTNSGTKYCYVQPSHGWNLTLQQSGLYRFYYYPTDGWGAFTPVTLSATSLTMIANPPIALATPAVGATTTSPTLSTYVTGQNMALTFQGTQGQNIGLSLTNLTNLTMSGSSIAISISIAMPDGNSYPWILPWEMGQYLNCGASTCWPISLFDLPETGTYKIMLSPSDGRYSFSLTASLSNEY